MNLSVFGINHRYGLAPITLTCKDPFTEVIIHCFLGYTHRNELIGNGFLCFFYRKSGKFFGIDQPAALAEVILLFKGMFGNICTINNLDTGNVVCDGIFKVSLIMGRNGHNSTGSIICQHEVTDVKRNFLAVYRIDTGNTL